VLLMEVYQQMSYELAEQLTRRYSTSFSMSSRLFAARIRPHIYAVYGMTSGLSIALIVNQDGSVDLPREHFLNAELLDYFDENRPVNWRSVERDLPSKLHGYHLVAGSVGVQEILPRELEAMSF